MPPSLFEDEDASYFDIVKETRNKSQIYLRKPIEARFYQVSVQFTHIQY